MSGIFHNQAIQLINRRIDGLLNESQRLLLEEHLHSCDSCRDYANNMDGLSAHLQNEFHHRWDTSLGPPQKVSEQVMAKTRNIPMTNRISSGLKLLAGAMALILLGVAINFVVSQLQSTSPVTNAAKTVDTSPLSQERLLAFTSDQNGNLDIYTMHADGTDLTKLTNNPAKDYSPTWSPDGTHIAFVSDRHGNDNIYVMNFDGTNVVQLTDDEAADSVPLWSPDGTKIAYMSGSFIKKDANIHVVDLNGQNYQQLTNYAPGIGVVSYAWSPDSQYILFDVNFRIAQINANGGDITSVTPPTKTITPYYLMSKDSSILSYLTDCEDIKTFCYELRLAYRDGTHQESSTGFKTLKTPELCELKQTATWTGTFVKWSPDQSKILFAFTCEESGWFYISNADGSDFKPLTNYPILGNMPQNDVATFDWSSDSQSIVFMSALDKPEHESLYILNVNDALQNPELRPTSVNTLISQIMSPAWQPAP